MRQTQGNFGRPLAVFAAVAWLCLPACGSQASSSTGSGEQTADPAAGVEQIAKVQGSVRNGQLTLTVIDDGSAPGVSLQNFGTFSSGTVSFNTTSDGSVGSCATTANSYCAIVDATNNTGKVMQSMFTEITSYSDVTPTGTTVTWTGTAAPTSPAYTGVFQNTTIQAANYGDFTVGQTKTLEWKWDLGSPTATNFDFSAAVYATFKRTGYGGIFETAANPSIDACTTSGHSTVITGPVDDQEVSVALPFPFTLYDNTYDNAVIGSNGYLFPFKTGSTAPTASFTNAQIIGPVATIPYGMYVFWDDLVYDGTGSVCTATTGTKPNRVFTVTWKNAHIQTPQPAKTAPSAESFTYSIMLQEKIDRMEWVYNLPATITDLTRGISATTGLRGQLNGANFNQPFSFNRLSPYIPATSASYPSRLVATGNTGDIP